MMTGPGRRFLGLAAACPALLLWCLTASACLTQPPLVWLDARFFPEGPGPGFPLAAAQSLAQRQSISVSSRILSRNPESFDSKGIVLRWRRWGLEWRNGIAINSLAVDDWSRYAASWALTDRVALGLDSDFQRVHPSAHYQVFGPWRQGGLSVLLAPGEAAMLGLRLAAPGLGEFFLEAGPPRAAWRLGLYAAAKSGTVLASLPWGGAAGAAVWQPWPWMRVQGAAGLTRWQAGLGGSWRWLHWLARVGGSWKSGPVTADLAGGLSW